MTARVSITCLSLLATNAMCEGFIHDPVLRTFAVTASAGFAAIYLLLYGITQA